MWAEWLATGGCSEWHCCMDPNDPWFFRLSERQRRSCSAPCAAQPADRCFLRHSAAPVSCLLSGDENGADERTRRRPARMFDRRRFSVAPRCAIGCCLFLYEVWRQPAEASRPRIRCYVIADCRCWTAPQKVGPASAAHKSPVEPCALVVLLGPARRWVFLFRRRRETLTHCGISCHSQPCRRTSTALRQWRRAPVADQLIPRHRQPP